MPTLNDKKKKFQFPSSSLMLFILTAIVALLTWVVPSGTYDMALDEATGYETVVQGSYHYVEQTPVNLFRLFVAIQEGFIDGSQIIFLILSDISGFMKYSLPELSLR